jgi:hypothetical protein
MTAFTRQVSNPLRYFYIIAISALHASNRG